MDGCRPCNLTLVLQFKVFFSFWGANLIIMYWKAPIPVYCKWRRKQLTIVNWFQKLRSWFVTGFFAPVLSSLQRGIAESFDGFSSCTSEFPRSPSSDASLEDLSLGWTPRIEQSALYRDRIWLKRFDISSEEASSSSELDGLTRGNWEIYSSRCRMCWEARL